jgi:hypothetical protein
MRRPWVLATVLGAAGCSDNLIGVISPLVSQDRIGLDEVAPVGFSARDLLDAVGTPTFTTDDRVEEDRRVEPRLAAGDTFTVTLDDRHARATAEVLDADGIYQEGSPDVQPYDVLAVDLDAHVTSTDGFELVAPVRVTATALSDDGVSLSLGGVPDALPTWVADARAEAWRRWKPCPEADGEVTAADGEVHLGFGGTLVAGGVDLSASWQDRHCASSVTLGSAGLTGVGR